MTKRELNIFIAGFVLGVLVMSVITLATWPISFINTVYAQEPDQPDHLCAPVQYHMEIPGRFQFEETISVSTTTTTVVQTR